MKKAIVLLAREELPFRLCEHLLDNEYEVFAVDDNRFATEEYEEKWLAIGRNAHIHFHEIDQPFTCPGDGELCALFIPVSLYESHSDSFANKNLFAFLSQILKKYKKIKVVMIYPLQVSLKNAEFYKRIESIFHKRTYMIIVTNKK